MRTMAMDVVHILRTKYTWRPVDGGGLAELAVHPTTQNRNIRSKSPVLRLLILNMGRPCHSFESAL